MSYILGLESSCDDTGIACFDRNQETFLYEQTSSQINLHELYGGVVPQLAAREHLRNFPLLLEVFHKNFGLKNIDQIAVTCGPGLPGSLFIGIACAKSLSLILGIPLVGINHLRGHIFSAFLGKFTQKSSDDFVVSHFPHLHLLVSGGNSLLLSIDRHFEIETLAMTVDDAAGEALDKGAKLLGLKYPGGPEIDRYSQCGDALKYRFPQSFPSKDEMKFSFSGLKTSLRYFLEKIDDETLQLEMPNICASYQLAVVEVLVRKLVQSLDQKSFASIGISGGVSNNRYLRKRVAEVATEKGLPLFIPEAKYTGDNASMVAFASYMDPKHTLSEINFYPNLKL